MSGNMKNYETVIGIEIHAELSTKTKAFCSCGYSFDAEVNTQCCPGCLGMPGALPTLNKQVVEYALKMGLATNCTVNKVSKFDRKNYFYPDLARGYQITQYETPLCENGRVEFYHKGQKRSVRLMRIQIEEDTAKLLHGSEYQGTLLNFNRSGVPLIEIISEPDLRSGEEVKDYLEAVRGLLSALDICNCRMEEGTIRFDINVSVRPSGQKEFGTRVEMKNVNTFLGAAEAVQYEANRQIEMIEAGKAFSQQTRRWDEQKRATVLMRSKENALDYRYFPEPDLPPLTVSQAWINRVRKSLPELPVAKFERYLAMGIPESECRLLVEHPAKAAYFCACISVGGIAPKTVSAWIFGPLTALLNNPNPERFSYPGRALKAPVSIENAPVSAQGLVDILSRIEKGTVGIDAGKRILDEMFERGGTPGEIVKKLSLEQVSDEAALAQLVKDVLSANAQSVTDYKNGKSNAFIYLVGQCMKASKGKANPQMVNRILREELGS